MEPADPEQAAAPEEAPGDIWGADYLSEQALDPDDDGYLFGTAMGRQDS